MRIGLLEMKKFSKEFFEGIRDATFVEESCGIADLITSSLGGRNRQCAEAFVTSGRVSLMSEHLSAVADSTPLRSRSRSTSSRRRCSRGRSCKACRPLGSFMVRPHCSSFAFRRQAHLYSNSVPQSLRQGGRLPSIYCGRQSLVFPSPCLTTRADLPLRRSTASLTRTSSLNTSRLISRYQAPIRSRTLAPGGHIRLGDT
jgi:hypothetical protein